MLNQVNGFSYWEKTNKYIYTNTNLKITMFLKLSFKKERNLKHGLNEITNSVPYLQYFIKCLGLKHPILLNLQMSSGTPLARHRICYFIQTMF
jgi:hypothetical protein